MKSPANSDSTLESARFVTTVLLREPVKDAVKEALHEEGISIERSDLEASPDPNDGGSAGSKLVLVLALAALGGIAYVVRQRGDSHGGLSSGSGSDQLGEHHRDTESRSTEEAGEPGSSAVSEDF